MPSHPLNCGVNEAAKPHRLIRSRHGFLLSRPSPFLSSRPQTYHPPNGTDNVAAKMKTSRITTMIGLPSLSLQILLSLLFSLSLLTSANGSSIGDYDEKLVLKPLKGQSLLATFNFRSLGSAQSFNRQMFQLLPRSLGQVLHNSKTRELHLKFTLGRWDAERWGTEPENGHTAGGTGVELWAWVEADTDEEAEERWSSLTNSLSGLFCASLNFIDETRTIRPVMSFEPSGDHPLETLSKLHLLHGTLPREPVCTENLTPFLKLLPCKGKAGISSLLDGHKLFDASYQAMSIDFRPVCSSTDTNDCKIEMKQTISMVVDIERSLYRRDSPVPRPPPIEQMACDASKNYDDDACFPLDNSFDPQWSLSDVFGRKMRGYCPLAGEEHYPVCLITPSQRNIEFSPEAKVEKINEDTRCFKLEADKEFDLTLTRAEPQVLLNREEPLIYAERTFTGHGQERGGVQAVLRNPSASEPVELVYLESLPWFMRPYLHTFSAKLITPSSRDRDEDVKKPQQGEPEEVKIIKEVYYKPSLDRKRGTQLEARMVVPQNSSVLVTYDFEKALLRYTEYPPDANRGFDIPSAIITILHKDPKTGARLTTAIRTTALLLSLPTPDFSMPYNVIIFTSTVMALAFGTIFNLLVRRFVLMEDVPRLGVRIRGVVRKLVGKLKRKRSEEDEKKTQ